MMVEAEIWVPIFRDYEISNMGRVRSNKRAIPIILKTYRQNRDYHLVHLRINGKRKALTIHRLVALIFLKNCDPNKNTVNHHNGKDDNRACSLSWMTYSENSKHGADNDLLHRGDKHYKTKLDGAQVRIIKSLKGQLKVKHIASYFTVKRQVIESIWSGKSWGHIPAPLCR